MDEDQLMEAEDAEEEDRLQRAIEQQLDQMAGDEWGGDE